MVRYSLPAEGLGMLTHLQEIERFPSKKKCSPKKQESLALGLPAGLCFTFVSPFECADSFYVFFFFSLHPPLLYFQIGERIRVILDMEDKTLAFERGYEFLGVAFRGLPKVCLYPAVSAVYGNTEVTLVYLGKPLDG